MSLLLAIWSVTEVVDRSVLFFCDHLLCGIVKSDRQFNHQYRRKEDERQEPDREDREKDEDVEVSFFLCHVWYLLSDE